MLESVTNLFYTPLSALSVYDVTIIVLFILALILTIIFSLILIASKLRRIDSDIKENNNAQVSDNRAILNYLEIIFEKISKKSPDTLIGNQNLIEHNKNQDVPMIANLNEASQRKLLNQQSNSVVPIAQMTQSPDTINELASNQDSNISKSVDNHSQMNVVYPNNETNKIYNLNHEDDNISLQGDTVNLPKNTSLPIVRNQHSFSNDEINPIVNSQNETNYQMENVHPQPLYNYQPIPSQDSIVNNYPAENMQTQPEYNYQSTLDQANVMRDYQTENIQAQPTYNYQPSSNQAKVARDYQAQKVQTQPTYNYQPSPNQAKVVRDYQTQKVQTQPISSYKSNDLVNKYQSDKTNNNFINPRKITTLNSTEKVNDEKNLTATRKFDFSNTSNKSSLLNRVSNPFTNASHPLRSTTLGQNKDYKNLSTKFSSALDNKNQNSKNKLARPVLNTKKNINKPLLNNSTLTESKRPLKQIRNSNRLDKTFNLSKPNKEKESPLRSSVIRKPLKLSDSSRNNSTRKTSLIRVSQQNLNNVSSSKRKTTPLLASRANNNSVINRRNKLDNNGSLANNRLSNRDKGKVTSSLAHRLGSRSDTNKSVVASSSVNRTTSRISNRRSR